MSKLSQHLPFVNDQISFQEKQIAKFSQLGKFKSEFREKLHAATRDKFKELAADIIVADQELDTCAELAKKKTSAAVQLSLLPDEIDGLPEDLLKELSISDGDKTDFAIVAIINDAGGVQSMDRILIGLYKKTGEIFKRNAMTSKLYRMSQKGLVFSVPNKKGWYSTDELSDADVERIFGTK